MHILVRHRRTLIIMVLAVVGGGLLLRFVDLRALARTLRAADTRLLFAALAFFFLGTLMVSVRWRYVLRMQPAFRPTYHTDSIAYTANLLIHLPAPASRIVAISRVSPVTVPQSASGMVVERLFEQIMRLTALVLTIVLAVSGSSQSRALVSGLAVLALMASGIYLLIVYRERLTPPAARALGRLPRLSEERVRRTLDDLLGGLTEAATPRQLLFGMALSLVLWGCFYAYQYLTLLALDTGLPPPALAGPAMLTLAVAPPTAPAMLGIYHGVVIASLTLAWPGHLNTVAAYALVLHAIQLLVWSVLGIWGLTQVNFRLGELRRSDLAPAEDQEMEPA